MKQSLGMMLAGAAVIAFVLMFGTTVGDVMTTILGEVVITGTNVTKELTVAWLPSACIIATIGIGGFIFVRGFMGLVRPSNRNYPQ